MLLQDDYKHTNHTISYIHCISHATACSTTLYITGSMQGQ